MTDIQRFFQRNSRRLFAAGALIFSLLLFTLLMSTGPGSKAWIARNPISAGSKIESGSLQLVSVNLGTSSSHYFAARDLLVGQYATRTIPAGDLIATGDVSRTSAQSGTAFLSIGVLATDVSTMIESGQYCDIYVIPKDSGTAPALVLSRSYVESVDSRSRSLGGSVEISLALNPAKALLVVEAESQGRLVVAQDAN